MTAYLGLAISINTITFQTATQLDFCNIQKMATAAGLKNGLTNKPYDVSKIANLIGSVQVAPIDVATAYATLASVGVRCEPIALTSITDALGKSYPVPGAACQRTMTKKVAAGVTYALQYMLVHGSGYAIPLNDKATAFAKTGTTDWNVETWTVGANSGIATASWFGSYQGNGEQWHNQDITINGVYYPNIDGNQLAGSQWAAVMNAAAGNPVYPLTAPPALMLNKTAPLIAGTNDPMAASRVPGQHSKAGNPRQQSQPHKPAKTRTPTGTKSTPANPKKS